MGSGWGVGEVLLTVLCVVIVAGIVAIMVWTFRTGLMRPPASRSAGEHDADLDTRPAQGEVGPDGDQSRVSDERIAPRSGD